MPHLTKKILFNFIQGSDYESHSYQSDRHPSGGSSGMQRNDYSDNNYSAQSDSYRQNTSSDRGQFQSVSSMGLPKPIPARRDDRSMSPMQYNPQYETFDNLKKEFGLSLDPNCKYFCKCKVYIGFLYRIIGLLLLTAIICMFALT